MNAFEIGHILAYFCNMHVHIVKGNSYFSPNIEEILFLPHLSVSSAFRNCNLLWNTCKRYTNNRPFAFEYILLCN